MANAFHLTVGDNMTWQFTQNVIVNGLPSNKTRRGGRVTFRVAAIADLPPALTDQFDEVPTAIVPPAVTTRYLNGEFGFGWIAMRLVGGDAGFTVLQHRLARLTVLLIARYHFPIALDIRRMAIAKQQAQQAIEPQALAVGVPLGIVAGRWAWTSFANSIDVVPASVVPTASVAVGLAALFIAGNLVASGPALIAARIAPAATFRAE